MNKRWLSLAFVLCLAWFVACQAATPTATPVPPTAQPTAAPTLASQSSSGVTLDIVGPEKTVSLTVEEVRALPAVEGWAGIKNSAGNITPPVMAKGVLFKELCDLVGGITPEQGINVVAKDGYAMSFSYDQAINAKLITYDPGTGDEITIDEPLQLILAYEMDGKPLNVEMDGEFRIMAISPKNNQVVDGHWNVKWVRQVQVKDMAEDWVLPLKGTISEDMDRASFESCAAPGCHGKNWTDDEGQKWRGVPLWLLVGRVDDDVRHQSRAFSGELAEAGYTVEVVAADGYAVTFDSKRIRFDDDYIVAHEMNDEVLENKYFPLRLVGPNLSKQEFVGQLAGINLDIPESSLAALPTPTPVPSPTPGGATPTPAAPAEGSDLSISGLVDKPTSLSLDQSSPGLATIQAEHPKSGMTTYKGFRLSDLLASAGVKADVKKVIFIAADGFKSEVPLADLNACADCMLAIADDGTLSAVMPGMASNFWAKNVVQIDVQ